MSRAFGVALVAAGAAFSWWEGGLHQYSSAAHAGVAVVIALVLTAALALGWGRQATTAGDWVRGPLPVRRHLAERPRATAAVVIWVVLLLAVVGWDVGSFVHQSHNLPTLSSIVGHVTSSRAGRAATVAVWLVLGASLAVGWRRRR